MASKKWNNKLLGWNFKSVFFLVSSLFLIVVVVLGVAQILKPALAQAADSIPPTAPTAISATPQPGDDCCKVTFSFRGSTDNVGIVKYLIYSNGNFSSTVNANGNTDDTYNGWTYLMYFGPKETVSLTVKAVDAAGNMSPPSNEIVVTSPGIPVFVSDISMAYSSSRKAGNTITTKVYAGEIDPWKDAKRGMLKATPINNTTVTLTITSPSGQKTLLSGVTQGTAVNAGTVTFTIPANEKGTYVVGITSVSATNRHEYFPHIISKTLVVN